MFANCGREELAQRMESMTESDVLDFMFGNSQCHVVFDCARIDLAYELLPEIRDRTCEARLDSFEAAWMRTISRNSGTLLKWRKTRAGLDG